MDFSSAQKAQLSGQTVRLAWMVEFNFVSVVKRLWNGWRNVATLDGKTWEGMFGLGDIQGLEQPINGAAPELRTSVSGVDADFYATAKSEATEYFNRPLRIYGQFFDSDWKPLDMPFAAAWALMRSLVPQKEATDEGIVRTITLTSETPFGSTKRRPRQSYCTDTDQKLRYPGDKGMERVAGIDVRLVVFPDY